MSEFTGVKDRLSAFLAEKRQKAQNNPQAQASAEAAGSPSQEAPASKPDSQPGSNAEPSAQSVTAGQADKPAAEEGKTSVEAGAVTKDAGTEAPQDNQTTDEEEVVWDFDTEPDKPTTEADVNFKKLGSALGLEISSEAELVEAFKKQSERVKQLEEAANKTFDGLDETLRDVIEFVRKGGNWKEYVTQMLVDFSQLDPIKVFEEEFELSNAHLYKKPDGTIDWEKLDNELNNIPDSIKIMHGKQIIQNLKAQQVAKVNELKAQVDKRRDEFNQSLSEAVQNLGKVFGSEVYGLKVEPKHVSAIHSGVVSGKLTLKHLGVDADALIRAGVDARKLVETLAKAEWSESIAQYRYKQGKAQAKRELLERTQNVVLPSAGQAPAPVDVSSEQKRKTAYEKMAEYMSRFR